MVCMKNAKRRSVLQTAIFPSLSKLYKRSTTFTTALMDGEIPTPPVDPGEAAGGNYIPVILGTISLFGLVVGLVSHYSNIRSQPWYVSTVCIIGWCFPFWIVLLLPIDMASVRLILLSNPSHLS